MKFVFCHPVVDAGYALGDGVKEVLFLAWSGAVVQLAVVGEGVVEKVVLFDDVVKWLDVKCEEDGPND